MKNLFISTIFIFLFALAAFGQSSCPPQYVCISREAAITANENADKVKGFENERKNFEAQLKAKDEFYKGELAAKDKSYGERLQEKDGVILTLTSRAANAEGKIEKLETQAVLDNARIDSLIKKGKNKCFGLCYQSNKQ